MLKLEEIPDGFRVLLGRVEILRHTSKDPLLSIARADFHYTSRGGQHSISNPITGWIALQGFELSHSAIRLYAGDVSITLNLKESDSSISCVVNLPDGFNYARLKLLAEPGEAVYGGGIQYSYLNLRGRCFPIWTSEAGIGRNKQHIATILADLVAGAGGDYWTTYYPQPSFLSTRRLGFLLECDSFSLLDFRASDRHVIEFLNGGTFHCFTAPDLNELIRVQSKRTGIQPAPPPWVYEGGILGIQGGLPFVSEVIDRLLDAGAVLSGVWTQDWQGIRMVPNGKRLLWNWRVDDALYPNLAQEIQRRAEQGIRWLGYLNPYFNVEGEQFPIAQKHGYLACDTSGSNSFVFGEFTIGMLDLTNLEACAWYKEIIQKNLLDLGLRGWMADYGEDVMQSMCFSDGRIGKDLHNIYPRLWAEINRQAVVAAGLQEDVLIFHRSGYLGQNHFANMQWAGDQLVGWDRHDGFPSAVVGGLSATMSGIQYYHSDAGGYTTVAWYKRSKELLMRWCEINAFSPVLRTHEGNRPWRNAQPWTDAETINAFASATRMHAALAPYLLKVSDDAQRTGVGMMRPFCLTNAGTRWCDKRDAWYLGSDMLVFPVLHPGVRRMTIDIPEGEWTHLFTGRSFGASKYTIDCPIGYPAVFYRQDTPFLPTFESVRAAVLK